jgi:hypothetical protein
MNWKLALGIVIIMALWMLESSTFAVGYDCFQNIANTSSNCSTGVGGSYTLTADGTWTSPTNAYDGNWGTSAGRLANAPGILAKYKIPIGVTTAVVTYKLGTENTRNSTVPTACFDYAATNNNVLTFKLNVSIIVATYYAYISCQTDASDNMVLINSTQSAASATANVYEMGVTWINQTTIRIFANSERTGQLLNNEGYLEVWGSNTSSTYTFYDGRAFIEASSDELFNLRAYVSPFSTRNYYYNLNQSNNLVNIFLLNTSLSLLTQVTVTDMASTPYPGAFVEIYKQVQGFSTYQLVDMGRTDNNGITVIYLEPYSVPYLFKVKYNGVYIFNSSLPAVISSATTYIKVGTLNDTSGSYYAAQSIYDTIYYSNISKGFYFIYNDTTLAGVTDGYLEVQLHTALTDTMLCNNTLAAANGAIFCNMTTYLNRTGTFTAQSFIKLGDGITYYLDSTSKVLNVRLERAWGLSGPFYAFIIVLVMFSAGLWNPVAAVILGCLGLVLSVAFGLLPISTTWLIGLCILAFIGVRRLMA